MEKDNFNDLPDCLIMPFLADTDKNNRCNFHYSKNIDAGKSDYYKYQIYFLDLLKIKRLINDFVAKDMVKGEPYLKSINEITEYSLRLFFFIITPLLDKADIDLYLQDNVPGADNVKTDDNQLASLLYGVCIQYLLERVLNLYGYASLGVLYNEFLRIIDATIEHFSGKHTIKIQQLMNMFLEPPKLMSEQWILKYRPLMCVYPWRAFELLLKLEECMSDKKDKDAMLYVHAAIEAGVVIRKWELFETQYGTKYCDRKTYNKYTQGDQRYKYYTKEELVPLIQFFEQYKPSWAKSDSQ